MNQSTNEGGQASDDAPQGPSERGPEIALALILVVLAGLVIKDSVRIGTGWADDGPQSGYFPFYIGLFLLASSASILIKALLGWKKPSPLFAENAQLATVFAMLIPMVVYVVVMIWMGIYLPSVVLIAYFMRRYGKFGWLPTSSVSLGVPISFFLVFERWFLVPLPKGPIENLLGF
jgi:putative tricarboxylic transport membrane protein